jgi:hypothetical protein
MVALVGQKMNAYRFFCGEPVRKEATWDSLSVDGKTVLIRMLKSSMD